MLSEENRIRIHAQIDLGAAKTSQKYPTQKNEQSSKQPLRGVPTPPGPP